MTKTQLHSIPGFHPDSLLNAAAFLRKTIPRHKAVGDATAIIRNEGLMNGFLDAIEALEAAATQQPPTPEKKPFQPYSEPKQAHPPENQNKP